jgi:hypothetical protein
VIDVGAIGEKHISNGATVLILPECLKLDFLPEGEGRGGVLGVVAVGLALLRAVDAAEADVFRKLVVQNFERVAVEDGDDGADEVGG